MNLRSSVLQAKHIVGSIGNRPTVGQLLEQAWFTNLCKEIFRTPWVHLGAVAICLVTINLYYLRDLFMTLSNIL